MDLNTLKTLEGGGQGVCYQYAYYLKYQILGKKDRAHSAIFCGDSKFSIFPRTRNTVISLSPGTGAFLVNPVP